MKLASPVALANGIRHVSVSIALLNVLEKPFNLFGFIFYAQLFKIREYNVLLAVSDFFA